MHVRLLADRIRMSSLAAELCGRVIACRALRHNPTHRHTRNATGTTYRVTALSTYFALPQHLKLSPTTDKNSFEISQYAPPQLIPTKPRISVASSIRMCRSDGDDGGSCCRSHSPAVAGENVQRHGAWRSATSDGRTCSTEYQYTFMHTPKRTTRCV